MLCGLSEYRLVSVSVQVITNTSYQYLNTGKNRVAHLIKKVANSIKNLDQRYIPHVCIVRTYIHNVLALVK